MKTIVPINNTSLEIQDLVTKRNQARTDQNFQLSDTLKSDLIHRGFEVRDSDQGTELWQDDPTTTDTSFTVLFGSGEIAAVSQEVHTKIFTEMGKSNLKIAILSTPAGFQPNFSTVYQEIADFFAVSLQNFHPQISLVFANNRDLANNDTIIEPLATADYIFTGPGSPTYAINHLRDTKAFNLIQSRVEAGVSLGLASAATIAWSEKSLPVYEIYKVGEELHWVDGLGGLPNFLSFKSVVPHFNNTEGGVKTDTTRCYMGQTRFENLLALLPPNYPLVGIDEHTALVIDNARQTTSTFGSGGIHHLSGS